MALGNKNYKARSKKETKLAQAIQSIQTIQEALNLLRDLLTPKEIEEFARRFKIARLLNSTKLSYEEIAKKMSTSTTTVTRVALWLKNGCGGYRKAIERLKK